MCWLWRWREDVTAKECSWPLEAERGRDSDSPQSSQEGTQPGTLTLAHGTLEQDEFPGMCFRNICGINGFSCESPLIRCSQPSGY